MSCQCQTPDFSWGSTDTPLQQTDFPAVRRRSFTCCCPLTLAVLGHTGTLPGSQTPGQRVLQQVHHQLYSPARSIDPSYASGPSYKMRLGFRALLTPLCYHVSVLPAFSFIVIPRPCSNLLFFLTSTAVNPNPGCLWLLKPPPTHDCPCSSFLEEERWKGTRICRHAPCKAFVNAFWSTWVAFCWCQCQGISPAHPSSAAVTGYITVASSRIRFPPWKHTEICLWLQVSHPKELKNLFPLYRWGPQSHTTLAAVPRTILAASEALAWSGFSSAAAFFGCFPPTLALPSNFEGQQSHPEFVQELLSLNTRGLCFLCFTRFCCCYNNNKKNKTRFFIIFF